MQGNSISIIEKESGTYIIFGADPEIPLEMCAQKGASSFGTGFLITQEPGSDSEDSSGSLSQPTSSSASLSMSHSPIHSPRPIYPFLGYSGRPEDSMDPREFIPSQTAAPLHPELEATLPTQPFSFPHTYPPPNGFNVRRMIPLGYHPPLDTLSHANEVHFALERLGEERPSLPAPLEDLSRPQTPYAYSERSQAYIPTQDIPLLRLPPPTSHLPPPTSHLPPPTSSSPPANHAIQQLSDRFEAVTRPASVTTLGSPLPPTYHSQIYAEAHQSLLGTLQDLANYNPNLREILLEFAYGLPGERAHCSTS
ncbi:hypothetical protein SCLCIDRAFT_34095 [Scleroderma citrinum Foug A]|uniref:Uncharacterized protein n=1 Tax=Scleroderma citrinum Foug A TaxID=1036808 RepID=A0A0C2ZCC8_9AGAM|nr:hypothetical protein SCLCIDRAFT_34095 [Scleroderma citrinum Foug A]